MNKAVTLKPRLSEKSYALSEERNTYMFDVPADINRQEIARAVGAQYKVSVETVRVAAQPSRSKKTYKRRGRVVHSGRTSPVRKAYVRLKDGDKLPIFAAVEEPKKSDKESK
jgi:large subunit ribosomal protein L23